MPLEDYTTASKGALKIKGVQGSKVDKHKKKKKREKKESEVAVPTDLQTTSRAGNTDDAVLDDEEANKQALDKALASEDEKEVQEERPRDAEKTEAQRRFEERRRKMVCCL